MKGLARDTVIVFAERVVRLLTGVLVAMYLARALGPSRYGVYSYAVSMVTLCSFLAQAGLEPILVRELVRQKEALTTLRAALLLRLGGGVAAALGSLLLARLTSTRELPVTGLVAVMALVSVLQASHVLDAWLLSRQAFRASSTVKTIAIVAAGLARIAAVTSSTPLLALALVAVGEAALTGWLLWIAARGLRIVAIPERAVLTRLWASARPMLLSSFAIVIYSRADVVLLGQLTSPEEVGMYAAASQLSEAFYLVPIALMQAATPRLTQLHEQDDAAFRAACIKLVRLCSLLGLAVAVAVTLLAPIMVTLIYGARFAGTPSMLAVHVWSTWMVFVSVATEPWYIHRQLQHRYVRKTLLAALANVALNVLLIPRYGGVGAAVATVVSYALSAFACNVLWADTRDLFWLQLRAMVPIMKPVAS
ncbi:MAG: flippase [Polyangiales bacterium]